MNYSDFYRRSKKAVENALIPLWCGEAITISQRDYAEQIRREITSLTTPSEDSVIVEFIKNYVSVDNKHLAHALELVKGLWTKSYAPYKHQYDSWKALLEDNKSIVVTTGTGSGKTECFMIPMVADLIDNYQPGVLQAFLLYPLNALMEDQKERLEELLQLAEDKYGVHLTFAVYNGELPEIPAEEEEDPEERKKIERKIDIIRGREVDKATGHVNYKFKHIVTNRKELRNNGANIVLTNPTMLEYILLRKTDNKLINTSNLSWVALDETHTYTGAGAAEIAMLLRRVLLAFDKDASKIRFATSSATMGNPKNHDEEEAQETMLKDFIAGITGVSEEGIVAIKGKTIEENIPDNSDSPIWRKIIENTYSRLIDLYPEEDSTEDRLALLDSLCDNLPEEYLFRIRVHFFFRVPNSGLYVNLNHQDGGSFEVVSHNYYSDKGDATEPLIELERCNNCGEYLAIAEVEGNGSEKFFKPIESSDNDMFSLEENQPVSDKQKYVFALSTNDPTRRDSNILVAVKGPQFFTGSKAKAIEECRVRQVADFPRWRTVANVKCCCPACGTKLTHSQTGQVADFERGGFREVMTEDEDVKKIRRFRISSDFMSRLITPEMLDQTMKFDPEDCALHEGQHFISFVDSREKAAIASLRQNLEEERIWLYSSIYKELIRLKTDENRDSISLLDIYDLLSADPTCDIFARQFAIRKESSPEFDDEGNLKEETKDRYIFSILVELLSSRPKSAVSPETLGLFTTHYPKIESVVLPESVERFNELLDNESLAITIDDWKNLLKIFLDYTVRSNQSVFLNFGREFKDMDIMNCGRRFATSKPRRRPAKKPVVKTGIASRVVRYLGKLLSEGQGQTIDEAISANKPIIEEIIDSFWDNLTGESYQILQWGTIYDKKKRKQLPEEKSDPDQADPIRLNLADVELKLYSDVYMCPTNTDRLIDAPQLRPVDTLFKGYSPYLIDLCEPYQVPEELKGKWQPFPLETIKSESDLKFYAERERGLLWNNHLWNEDGIFANLLDKIHLNPKLFIQAEHTAQVDRSFARSVQEDFKDHKLNVLACSTTFEMGVDLGDLESVLLMSVPPQPANYKQRVGRSGRDRLMRKSMAITLCGSDPVGLRTLQDPLAALISRAVEPPMVDLKSEQVVRRHINAFLVREFDVLGGKSTSQKVVDYYTPYSIRKVEGVGIGKQIVDDNDTLHINPEPQALRNDDSNIPYNIFNNKCLAPVPDELAERLGILLHDAAFKDLSVIEILNNAMADNQARMNELRAEVDRLKFIYDDAEKAKKENPKREKSLSKYQGLLRFHYYSLFNKNLLTYWSANRFTPNANMPVNVVEFDIQSENFYNQKSRSSNPSYNLRTALSQYVPGNTVTIDGNVHVVRGVKHTNWQDNAVSFKHLYRNDSEVKFDVSGEGLGALRKWQISGGEAVTVIQPKSFLQDINEESSRIIEAKTYTRVDAQLIGTKEWENEEENSHLMYQCRSNRENVDGQILYYNQGIGHGYCYCTRCGRTVLETSRPNPISYPIPEEMNPNEDKNGVPFHFKLEQEDECCSASRHPELYRRNVIIGDLIQTDFTEIRIRNLSTDRDWIKSREKHEELLTTLGLSIVMAFVELIGKERDSVDFTITPNGHICVFDTNPGGSGYSNRLANPAIFKATLKKAENILRSVAVSGSSDALVEKGSLRLLNKLNVLKAYEWIKQLTEPDFSKTTFGKLLDEIGNTSQVILFVGSDYPSWNFSESDSGWKNQVLNRIIRKASGDISIKILTPQHSYISEDVKAILRDLKPMVKTLTAVRDFKSEVKLMPLAYVNGVLYFTDNADFAQLNQHWAETNVFSKQMVLPEFQEDEIDLAMSSSTEEFIINEDLEITSNQIAQIVYLECEDLIKRFLDAVKDYEGKVEFLYHDRYLNSTMGIAITLQFIDIFARTIGKPVKLNFELMKFDNMNSKNTFDTSLPMSSIRNAILKKMAEDWFENSELDGEVESIKSLDMNQSNHWRVLEIRCGEKSLKIYPDGGFANGWRFNVTKAGHKFYTVDNVTVEDKIPIISTSKIRFVVSYKESKI